MKTRYSAGRQHRERQYRTITEFRYERVTWLPVTMAAFAEAGYGSRNSTVRSTSDSLWDYKCVPREKQIDPIVVFDDRADTFEILKV
jgi:hypothetical protein